MEYEILRSRRKTLALEITPEAKLIVRAPLKMSRKVIEEFVAQHEAWVQQRLPRQIQRMERRQISPEEKARLQQRAKEFLPGRVAFFSARMGLVPTGIKITSAEHRFGSCNGKNSVCFSWWLMQYPESAIDYVVVPELAHIRYKNHGKEFYAFIETYLPDFKERIALLKK